MDPPERQVTSHAPPVATRFSGFRSEEADEEAEFEDFSAMIYKNSEWTAIDILEHSEFRWDDPDKRIRFFRWQRERCMKRLRVSVPRLSPRQCVINIRDTSFFDSARRGEWHWMMEMVFKSFVVIGRATYGGVTTAYGIDPGPSYLLPHDFSPGNHCQGGFLHHSILGIDLTQGGRPTNDAPQRPKGMKLATEAAVLETYGGRFLFAQIGSLWAFQGHSDLPADELYQEANTKPGPWEATRFGVVVQINQVTGKPGAVYIIYNFWARGNNSKMNNVLRPPVRGADNNILPHIGRLHPRCDPEYNFIVAKIADSIDELFPSDDSVDYRKGTFSFDPFRGPGGTMLNEPFICPVKEMNINNTQCLVQHWTRANAPA